MQKVRSRCRNRSRRTLRYTDKHVVMTNTFEPKDLRIVYTIKRPRTNIYVDWHPSTRACHKGNDKSHPIKHPHSPEEHSQSSDLAEVLPESSRHRDSLGIESTAITKSRPVNQWELQVHSPWILFASYGLWRERMNRVSE
jgi:hypothetical protein